MTTAEAAGEAAVFPGMIEAIVGIVAARIVPNPGVIVVDMRSFRMTGVIAERTMIFLRAGLLRAAFLRAAFGCAIFRARRSTSRGRRSVSRNVAATDIARAAALLFTTRCLAAPFLRKSRRSECEK